MDALYHIIEQVFGWQQSHFQIKYLGIPLRPGRLLKEDRRCLLNRLGRKLENSKGKFFLLRAVLS